jgi:TatD DNase family protein
VDKFFNVHTHHQPQSAQERIIRNAYTMLPMNVLSSLPYQASVGIHPWYIDKYPISSQLDYIEKALALDNVVALGECGLDKSITTDIENQKIVLMAQLELVNQYQMMVIIHCVRAYYEINEILKKYPTLPKVVFHQYRGNKEVTKELLKQSNVLFSFGKDLFQPTHSMLEVLKMIPIERILCETDTIRLPIAEVWEQLESIKLRGEWR